MVIEACTCNWGIPGVYRLPAHTHIAWPSWVPRSEETGGHPFDDTEISIWVNWKEVARKLTTTASRAG